MKKTQTGLNDTKTFNLNLVMNIRLSTYLYPIFAGVLPPRPPRPSVSVRRKTKEALWRRHA